MIITFFGHASFFATEDDENLLMQAFESIIGEKDADFYLGGYGGFDAFACRCAKKYKALHKKSKLYFITPYISENYYKKDIYASDADFSGVIYPPIEKTPPRFAISKRNDWMVRECDIVFTRMRHTYGRSYQFIRLAERLNKRVVYI